MGKVTDIGSGVTLSISSIATEFGVTRETATKRIAEANVTLAVKVRGYPVYRLRDVWRAVSGMVTDNAEDPQKLDPFRRVAHYKAELDRLRLETETRELIPRIEVEQEQARILKIIAQLMDTLPDIVERDCGATADQVKRIERATDEAREHVFQELAEDEHAPAIREGA
jgi:hypothetical protein